MECLGSRMVKPIGLGCMSLSWGYGAMPEEAVAVALLNRHTVAGPRHGAVMQATIDAEEFAVP